MTRDELHIAFKVELDKNSNSIAYGGCPAFIDAEIDYWLNKALYDVIIDKFTGGGSDIKFEGSVKRISDLERLVRTDKNLNVDKDPDSNCVHLESLLNKQQYSKGRMLFVQAVLKWTKDNITNSATVKLISHVDAKQFIKTYNNTPWIEDPVGIIKDNTLFIYYDPISMIGDKYTLDITYVKHPCLVTELPPTSALDELPQQTWYQVINRAVQLALDNIESQRLTTNTQINETEE